MFLVVYGAMTTMQLFLIAAQQFWTLLTIIFPLELHLHLLQNQAAKGFGELLAIARRVRGLGRRKSGSPGGSRSGPELIGHGDA